MISFRFYKTTRQESRGSKGKNQRTIYAHMVRLICFLSVFIFFSSTVFSQINSLYASDSKSLDFNYRVYLCDKGKYSIEIYRDRKPGESVIISHLISMGYYKLKGNKLILTDKSNKLDMEFIYYPQFIVAKKAYYFLSGIPLINPGYSIDEKDCIDDGYIKPYDYLRKKYNNNSKKLNPLTDGIYSYHDVYHLVLEKNGLYNFRFYDIEISKGSWRRDGNELILRDTILKEDLYIYIDSTELKWMSFLGCEVMTKEIE